MADHVEAPDSAAAKAELSQLRMCTLSMAAVGLTSLLTAAGDVTEDADTMAMRAAAMQMMSSIGPEKVHAFIHRSLLQAAQSLT